MLIARRDIVAANQISDYGSNSHLHLFWPVMGLRHYEEARNADNDLSITTNLLSWIIDLR